MKVLMISGDKNVLVPGTSAFERLQLQKQHVDDLAVFVWPHVHSKRQIWHAARSDRPDVITSQDPFWRGLLAWKIARLAGTRLNIQVHSDLSAEPFLRRVLARIVLRHADSVRTVSKHIQQQVERMGVRAPVRVLPIFVDVSAFRSVERRPHQGKNILWVGRFEKEKDPLYAIEVLKKVLSSIPDASLTMIGEGDFAQKLRAQSKHLPLTVPTGWQNPILFLDTADVVLCTSSYESWGATIVEALAAGVPVVAPDVGIAKEAGAIVVPREKLGDAVVKVLRSGERGSLALSLPTAEEWAQRWKETLV